VAAGRRFTDALRTIIVDITCVTEADQYGRALLLTMLRFGAQIIAKFSESFAIVQPIVTRNGSGRSEPRLVQKTDQILLERSTHDVPSHALKRSFAMSAGRQLTA
jgi:hypothetical protein